jgi:hypothetical protein
MTVIDLTPHDLFARADEHQLLPLTWEFGKRRVIATCSCGTEISRHRPEQDDSVDEMKAAFVRHVLGL